MMFGRSLILDVRHTDTVGMVKQYIEDVNGIPAHNMILVFAGIFLDDDQTLASYNICAESSVSLIIKDQSKKTLEAQREPEAEPEAEPDAEAETEREPETEMKGEE